MTRQTVVVTGTGVMSPLAQDTTEHFSSWLDGKSAVSVATETAFSELPMLLQAKVTGFERRAAITNRMLRKLLSPSAGYAVGAAGRALADAALLDESDTLRDCGLYVGSLSLEIEPEVFIPPLRASITRDGEFDISLFARRGMRLLDPLFLVRALPNAGICGISVEHQVLGPNTNITNGSTSGLGAVALAAAAIARGELTCAVAGGYDTLLTLDSIAEQYIAGRLSRYEGNPAQACKPFDARRDGLVLGEGAAFVVLESRAHADARGAPVIAEIEGIAETTNPSQLSVAAPPDGTALHMASSLALRRAARAPGEIGAAFIDGLGTVRDDLREAEALRMLGTDEAPVNAATSAIGFTGAASGVFSLIHATLSVCESVMPALANCEEPDPDCAVPFLTSPAPLTKDAVLVWNSDRGTKNIAMIVARA